MTQPEHVAFCDAQSALCREATCNESLTLMDRVGAQLGELDWITAADMAREEAV